MIPKECKRLTEVDFPIAVVSRQAAREKSIRHGHPSTLHLWWARRPLASSRAVLLLCPSDSYCSDDFKKRAFRTKADAGFATKRSPCRPLRLRTSRRGGLPRIDSTIGGNNRV